MSSVDYNMLISTLESTVVTEYIREDIPAYSYQSEADLEREFIKNLQNQGYEYLSIHNEKELIVNLKDKLEKLSKEAIKQIEEKKYDINLKSKEIKEITSVGIAFYGKKLKVSYK